MKEKSNLPVHIEKAFLNGGVVSYKGESYATPEALLEAHPDIATAHEDTGVAAMVGFSLPVAEDLKSMSDLVTQLVDAKTELGITSARCESFENAYGVSQDRIAELDMLIREKDKQIDQLKAENAKTNSDLTVANELLAADNRVPVDDSAEPPVDTAKPLKGK